MTVRPLKSSDIPVLKSFAEQSGFPYPEPNDINIEKVLVVTDDEDRPIIAVAAKRLVEVYAWVDPQSGAALRNEALVLIHPAMMEALKRLGYDCAEAFIPPQLERRGFGKWLESHGFTRNWLSWGKRIV